MSELIRLLRDRSASAAAEMALVTPLLCTILIGSVESGSYFYNQHILSKAVRDGARYAARQNFSYYAACSGTPTGNVEAETEALVRTSLLSNGTDRFPNIEPDDIDLTVSCKASQGGQNMTGIYNGRPTGAPIITVAASVDYSPVIGAPFGFSGVGVKMNASQEAAVQGI